MHKSLINRWIIVFFLWCISTVIFADIVVGPIESNNVRKHTAHLVNMKKALSDGLNKHFGIQEDSYLFKYINSLKKNKIKNLFKTRKARLSGSRISGYYVLKEGAVRDVIKQYISNELGDNPSIAMVFFVTSSVTSAVYRNLLSDPTIKSSIGKTATNPEKAMNAIKYEYEQNIYTGIGDLLKLHNFDVSDDTTITALRDELKKEFSISGDNIAGRQGEIFGRVGKVGKGIKRNYKPIDLVIVAIMNVDKLETRHGSQWVVKTTTNGRIYHNPTQKNNYISLPRHDSYGVKLVGAVQNASQGIAKNLFYSQILGKLINEIKISEIEPIKVISCNLGFKQRRGLKRVLKSIKNSRKIKQTSKGTYLFYKTKEVTSGDDLLEIIYDDVEAYKPDEPKASVITFNCGEGMQ
jgi:hypothetical protein